MSPAAAWSNWSGVETCLPARVVAPATLRDLQQVVRDAARRRATVRAVGSGHSFTGAAVAPDVQIRLDRMDGLIDLDPEHRQVTVGAGMTLRRLNAVLADHDLGLENLGDIDRQTVAGAISTGTHGTGAALGGLATQVVALQLVSADGGVVLCSAGADPDLFNAARVSVGALGVIWTVTLRCVPAFALRAVEAPAALEKVIDELPRLVDEHDHFEFYWFPHTTRVLTKANDRVEPSRPLQPLPRWRRLLDDEVLSNGVFAATSRLCAAVPSLTPGVNAVAARALTRREYVDASYRVFVSTRRVRFNESEYCVPRESVADVLRELRHWVDAHDERVPFPVEVRFAAADDLWLSTAYERVAGYVAVHQYHRMDHSRYFEAFERIVAEVSGRPHWGKLHGLDAGRLREVYPRFDAFQRLRDRVDPDRVFANAYTRRVLGP
ncbi:MAG: D-arabinono-1,4-lactone oxidase [Nocardioidaceae bacterium]